MAITRAQQAKQMLQDGGMLVQPGFGGTRQGYRGDAAYGGPDKGDGPASGGDARGDLTREQFMGTKGKTRTGPETGKGGQTINTPPQTSVFTDVFNTGLKNIKNIFGTPTTLDDIVKTKTIEDDDDDDVEYPTSGYDPKLDQKMKAEIFEEFANMKAEGGRIGYAIGGREKGDVGTTGPGKGDEDGFEEKKEKARQEDIEARTKQKELANLATNLAEDKKIERLERFMNINSPTRKFTRFVKKIPGFKNITFNNRDYFLENIAPPGFQNLTLSQQNKAFKDYMASRNTLDDDDDEGILQIPVDTTFARAPVEEEEDYYAGRNPFDINRIAYRLMADGGAVIDDEPRQAYGLGSIVKKATRAVKKVVKSPIGKAALAYGLTFGIPGVSSGFFSKGLMGTEKFAALSGAQKAMLGIGATSLLAGLSTPKEEEEDEEEFRGEGLDIPLYRRNPQGFLAPRFRAEGGSINEDEKEPVAKKVMPLIDMDGMEKDYRETGGFVDMGRMEKADDVPARLSKNEFVFTADAVRNAGDGSVDKGAEVMYNMMKNLEAGGEVSEESQGLKGARRMFQTSQRLEEVL